MKGSPRYGLIPAGVIFCAFFTFAAVGWAGTYSGGTGTAEDPYKISTVADWQELIAATSDYDKHFILLNDIDFEGVNLTPVAPDTSSTVGFQGTAFTGLLDGNGHSLSNLKIGGSDKDYIGLFGYLGPGGQIVNLGMINVMITGRNNVGSLLGGLDKGTISACYATGAVSGTGGTNGGLVGYNNGTISNCYAAGAVSGSGDNNGGLVGYNNGTISNCYAIGAVSGTSKNIGGLVGGNSGTIMASYAGGTVSGPSSAGGIVGVNAGTITACYATGAVRSTGDNVGGLIGYNNGTIIACNATGAASGVGSYSSNVGGLVGYNINSRIISCYASGTVSGSWYVGGLVGYHSSGSIATSYATSAVSGSTKYAGGLAGYNYSGTISACYATGAVSGKEYVGGLAGYNYQGTITDCLWDKETSGQITSAGGGGVVGKTTAQMKILSTYTDAGWDFSKMDGDSADWWMPEGLSPKLRWEEGNPEYYSGGSGTAEEPYRISTTADWQELIVNPADWGKQFVLLNDIDFGGTTLMPVAPDIDSTVLNGFQGTPFIGSLDGSGHVLINLTIGGYDKDYIGLIGRVGFGGKIRNLGVKNAAITGREYVGGLVGYNYQGTITACYATGTVSGVGIFSSNVGGLVGRNDYGMITACYGTGIVNGAGNHVGGLTGYNYQGTITACYAIGTVGGSSFVGGLTGGNRGRITTCYATGSASGSSFVGGLVGSNASGSITSCYATGSASGSGESVGGLAGYNFGPITTCYATGTVSGISAIGGLTGTNDGTIIGSFWDIETSGQMISAGGEGKTTAEMKTLSTFTDAGWDFVGEAVNGTEDMWRMCGDGVSYPRLSWEFSRGGDFACPDGVALEDLMYLAERWMAGTPAGVGAADGNGDGRVDMVDLAILSGKWGHE